MLTPKNVPSTNNYIDFLYSSTNISSIENTYTLHTKFCIQRKSSIFVYSNIGKFLRTSLNNEREAHVDVYLFE